jgi:Ca2+-binding EF-hand superfamily protein
LTFDDEQRETDRLSLDGLFNMLKDFDLISKQNSRTMEFYTPTALRWIRLGCLPALCKHGTLPVSKEEVNVVVRRWQRRKERNGLREDQLRLEDMDMEGFVRCFARICILGFRRLEATPSNMERNSWSTDAIEAFREASAPPPNKRKGRSWDENRDVGFRTIVGTQASIWLRTLAARRRRRPIDNVPLLRTDRRYVVTAKILEAYNAPSHLDYLTMEAAMSTNTYRDTNHLVRDLTQRDDEIHRLFDELDTGKSGSVHKKDLLKAIQSDGVAKRMIETSPALAPLLHPQTYKDAFDDIDTKRVDAFTFSEFNRYIQSFEQENAEDVLDMMVKERYARNVSRRRALRRVISKFQSRTEDNIVTRKDIAFSLADKDCLRLMKDASEGLTVLSDIELHDDAIDVLIDNEAEGLTYANLCKFCEWFDAIEEHLSQFKDSTEKVAIDAFGMRIRTIAAAKRAFLAMTATRTLRDEGLQSNRVSGVYLTLGMVLRFAMFGTENEKLVVSGASLAFAPLLKPASYRWAWSMMCNNDGFVTFEDFRDFCLSFEHRHARLKKLTLSEGDLVHLEQIREDGIWNRFCKLRSSDNGQNKGVLFSSGAWLKGELITKNRKRVGDDDHYEGAFPAECVEIIKVDLPDLTKDEAAVYIQAMVRGYIYRKKRERFWDAIIPIQTLVRSFLVKRRIARGHRVRSAVAADMVDIAKEATTAPAILEAILVRMECGTDKFHLKIQSKGKGFTFATGETPVVRDYRGNYSESKPANHSGPKYQAKRVEYVLSGMSGVDILRRFVVKNGITEKTLGAYMSEKCTRKFRTDDGKHWAYYYDDIWNVVNWVLGGNKGGSVLTIEEFEKSVIPRLDPKTVGNITQDQIVKVFFDAEGVDEEQIALKKSLKASQSSTFRPDRLETKESIHAQKTWVAQHHANDLEMTKKYSLVLYDEDSEKTLVDNIMGKYQKGLKMFFQFACNANHHQEPKNSFQRHSVASEQVTWTNAQNVCHDLRLIAPRTRVYVHLDSMGLKNHGAHQDGRNWNSKENFRNLPHGQFVRIEWIEDRKKVVNSVPRLTKIGALPLTVEEVRTMFRRRQKRRMEGRHVDTSLGMVRTEEMVLFLMDIATKAFPRMKICPDNIERELQSQEAADAYDRVYTEEIERTRGHEDVAVAKAQAEQKRVAEERIQRFVSALTPQQCVESLIWHIGLATSDFAELRRVLQSFGKGTFAYPIGFGIAEGPRGKGNTLGGPMAFPGKKTHHSLKKARLGNHTPASWIKRTIIEMAMESGKDLKFIFQQFDLDRNGTLEPHEIWRVFQQILPEGLGGTEFNQIILRDLYGIDRVEKRKALTQSQLMKLRVDFETFEDFVMSSDALVRTQKEHTVKPDKGRPRQTKKSRRQDLLPPGPYSQQTIVEESTKSSRYGQYGRQRIQEKQPPRNSPVKPQPQLPMQASESQQMLQQQPQQQHPQPQHPGPAVPNSLDSVQYSLLPGWFAANDPKTGMVYYYNPLSGERTWDWRKAISQAPPGKTLYTPRQTARQERQAQIGNPSMGTTGGGAAEGGSGPQPPGGGLYAQSPRVGRHLK